MSDTTQTGRGWSGLLVLNGKFDISPIYKQMIADQSGTYSAVFGDAQHGLLDFKQSDQADVPDMVAHIGLKLPIRPFSALMIGDVPYTTLIPSRGTTVAVWPQGHIRGGFQQPADLIIQLNREPIPHKINYTRLIRQRVIEPLEGKFAMCLGYFSRRPRIILATKNMELYTWIVFYNGVYMFVWSTDGRFLDRVRDSLMQERRNDLFALDVHLDNQSLIVIHPMYWITKFDKVLKQLQGRNARLLITAYFKNYLCRSTITRAETYTDEDIHGSV